MCSDGKRKQLVATARAYRAGPNFRVKEQKLIRALLVSALLRKHLLTVCIGVPKVLPKYLFCLLLSKKPVIKRALKKHG